MISKLRLAGLCVWFLIFGMGVGIVATDWTHKTKAIKAGKAEYYLDTNYIRQWRWNREGDRE